METSRGRVGVGETVCENAPATEKTVAIKTSKTVFFIIACRRIETRGWFAGRTSKPKQVFVPRSLKIRFKDKRLSNLPSKVYGFNNERLLIARICDDTGFCDITEISL